MKLVRLKYLMYYLICQANGMKNYTIIAISNRFICFQMEKVLNGDMDRILLRMNYMINKK